MGGSRMARSTRSRSANRPMLSAHGRAHAPDGRESGRRCVAVACSEGHAVTGHRGTGTLARVLEAPCWHGRAARARDVRVTWQQLGCADALTAPVPLARAQAG
jgi:hypothetical protein